MKKIIIILFGCLLISLLSSCKKKETIIINVENKEELNNNILGVDALIKIGNGLYYDSNTGIVYWWNGRINSSNSSNYDTAPTAYFAPNGFPYKYDPETNTFIEINKSK